ncbi:hypothetical protein ACW5R3_12365 [Bizionia sp. KMM 8389]
MEQKEIKIQKKSVNKILKNLLFAFLISIPILLIIQHFGSIKTMYGESGSYGFSSPIDNNMYYYPVRGKYFSEEPNYFEKLWHFYIPSIFVEGYKWIIIMTAIIFGLINLKQKFSKHYKIKIE